MWVVQSESTLFAIQPSLLDWSLGSQTRLFKIYEVC